MGKTPEDFPTDVITVRMRRGSVAPYILAIFLLTVLSAYFFYEAWPKTPDRSPAGWHADITVID